MTNERIEAIEHDLVETKKAVSDLKNQLKATNKELLNLNRSIASLYVTQDLLWALSVLNYPQNDPSLAQNADLCIRYARERASAALVEIVHSDKPMQIHNRWRSECERFFTQHGGWEIF